MRVQGTPPYKSPAKPYVTPGTPITFSPWVPAFGPTGRRNVIDFIEVQVTPSDISFTSAGLEGEDIWRLVERAEVVQVDGVKRINLQGDELRNYCYQVMGADRVPEYADIGTGSNQALGPYVFPLPLEKRYARRPKAFSLPAELLQEVVITTPQLGATGLGVGGGTVAVAGMSFTLLAHCHEEGSVELKQVDKVSSELFQGTGGTTLTIGGRLHGLFLMARGASGGASLTSSFTDIVIDGLLPQAMNRIDLMHEYLRDRGAAPNLPSTDGTAVHNDPVGQGRVVPIVNATEDTSSFDGALFDLAMVKTTMSQSSMLAVKRVVLPESAELKRAVEARHGIAPSEWRAKTISKGKNRASMSGLPYIEKSAPLKRRGLNQ
jgi:hypothetical protein